MNKNNLISWNYTLYRGWIDEKTTREVVPMVGWKMVHPSTVSNNF
jgi:hypothetical protein